MIKYLVLSVALISAVATSVKGAEIVGKDGKVLKVAEQKKKGFPSPRTYTTFYGMMGNDSIFVSNKGKYCMIKRSPKTGNEYAKWIKIVDEK